MEINWVTISILIICAIVIIYFIVKRNYKDEKDFEDYLNKNNPTIIEEEEDSELNDPT